MASIPAAHPYVRHLAAPDGPDPVVRLADPAPRVVDPMSGQWWPPVMLERDWVRSHLADFDVMHLHFGFDAADPAAVAGWCDDLAAAGRPLVLTVHDLVNPHFVDQARHRSLLDVLVPRADRLITLTPGAADEIRRRWERAAAVVPHPHVVPLDRMPAAATARPAGEFVIGVNAKNLRANIDPLPVLRALDDVLADLPGVVVRVDVHPEIALRADGRAVELREWLHGKQDHPAWRIVRRPRLTDDELWAYLRALDLCVLPYRFGTHSGWLEACVDLGTGVLVPDTGHYAQQHGHPTYHWRADGPVDRDRLVQVLTRIRDDPATARPPAPDRWAQRRRIAAAHERIYRDAGEARGRRG